MCLVGLPLFLLHTFTFWLLWFSIPSTFSSDLNETCSTDRTSDSLGIVSVCLCVFLGVLIIAFPSREIYGIKRNIEEKNFLFFLLLLSFIIPLLSPALPAFLFSPSFSCCSFSLSRSGLRGTTSVIYFSYKYFVIVFLPPSFFLCFFSSHFLYFLKMQAEISKWSTQRS